MNTSDEQEDFARSFLMRRLDELLDAEELGDEGLTLGNEDAYYYEQGLSRLVTDFSASEIRACLRQRLEKLDGGPGEIILRLVEAIGDEPLAIELANALEAQPDLPAERVWEVLSVLQNFEVLNDRPQLLERLEEWDAAIEEADSLSDDLARLMEETEEGPWLVVEGLGRMDPHSRDELILSFRELPVGQGLLTTLEILSASLDTETRDVARQVQNGLRHAAEVLGFEDQESGQSSHELSRKTPTVLGSLVTSLDKRGRATVGLHVENGGRSAAAAFECDVILGIIRVKGFFSDSPEPGHEWFDELARRPGREAITTAPGLARSLLLGSLSLCREVSPIELGYWLAAVLGEEPRARQVTVWTPALDIQPLAPAETERLANAVLDACEFWVDESALIYDLAEELLLRQDDVPPDPVHDEGLFRYAFEHRLRRRIRQDQRMLLWMAALWADAGKAELAQSALTIAGDLADAESTMPGHPFFDGLLVRSLLAAQRNLRHGRDPRDVKNHLTTFDYAWP